MSASARNVRVSLGVPVLAVLLAALVASPSLGAAPHADAQAGESNDARLKRAVALFNRAETQPQSISVFSELIDDIGSRGDRRSPQDTRILAQALAHRAQVRLNLGQNQETDTDLRELAKVDPAFVMDERTFSAPLIQMWNAIRPRPRGYLQISVLPKDAKVEVDSKPVNPASTVQVEPGTRTVFARHDRYQPGSQVVTVPPGVTVPVQITLERLPRPLLPVPRRLMVSVNQSYHVNREPTTSSFGFSAYRENSRANTNYQMSEGFKTLDFSAGVRLWGALGVGIAYSRLDTTSTGILDAPVPHPTILNANRPMTGFVEGLRREERAIHLEIRATGGNRRFEAAGFAGPSKFDLRQTVVNNFSFQDFVSRVTFVRADTLEARDDSAIGFHVGGDVSVMIVPYVGFGGFIRYSNATKDFDAGRSQVSVTAGGVQGGGGLRLRF